MSSKTISPAVIEIIFNVKWETINDDNAQEIHRILSELLIFKSDNFKFEKIAKQYGLLDDLIITVCESDYSNAVRLMEFTNA